jgi:glucose-6-phosphate isomerase
MKTLKDLFKDDSQRTEKFSVSAPHLFLDYSKNIIDTASLKLLFELTEKTKLTSAIEDLFSGKPINFTEHRAVLHTELRNPTTHNKEILTTLDKMEYFCNDIFNARWKGFSGKPITDIVNLGIGGSDLGPRMVIRALAPYHNEQLTVHCVSNVDGSDLYNTLKILNPETTLFIIASKTFSTIETLTNARTARAWLLEHFNDELAIEKHFIAISAKPELAVEFGIHKNNVFAFWDWVGGRFSLWSAIGLPIMLATSPKHFRALLAGAYEMDQHFKNTPVEKNMPVIVALISLWNINSFNAQTQAIIPYDENLKLFPAYLQQLEMESNGKCVNKQGEVIDYPTAPVIWGDVGTNGQHAFHQLLHQGTLIIPVDFIVALKSQTPLQHHHDLLFANCLAQSQALMDGTPESVTDPHKIIPGNKPSNMFVMEQLDPKTLGSLIALYEHKVFVQGILWNINSFDQYGVELGKQLANKLTPLLYEGSLEHLDGSTKRLIEMYREQVVEEKI